MLKTIPLHNGKPLCAVKVPEGASDFQYYDDHYSDHQVVEWKEPIKKIGSFIHNSGAQIIDEDGNWRILGIATELTEEQKKEVCEKWENTEYYQAFGTDLHVGYNLSRAYELFLAVNNLTNELLLIREESV